MGWDNASTIAQEVEDPQRNYPRAMFTSAVTVMCVYMLPLTAVWMAGIPSARFSTGAWVDAAMLLGGSALALSVVLAGSLDGLGTFNALTLSYTRLPYAMAEDGLLPRIFTKRCTERRPVGQRLSLQLRLGSRPRLHLRAPHLPSTSSSTEQRSCWSSSPSSSFAFENPTCIAPSASPEA